MSQTATLREAAPADAERLIGWLQAFYAEEGLAFDPSHQRDALDVLLADPALGRVWLVAHEHQAVGYAAATFGYSLEFGGRFALLDELWLDPAVRGRGLGGATLRAVGAACAALGCGAVRLEVERHNRRARGLYAATGFEAHDRDLMTWPLPR